MHVNVAKEVAALRKLTMRELRARYAEAFGETTNANNKAWLLKRIVWRLQANAEGDLSGQRSDGGPRRWLTTPIYGCRHRSRRTPRRRRAGRGSPRSRSAEREDRLPPPRHDYHPRIQRRDVTGHGSPPRL